MSTDLVTVMTFASPAEGQVFKNHLEAEGIPAILAGENAAGMDWLRANPQAGVRLQVVEKDLERALAVLKSTDDHVDAASIAARSGKRGEDDDAEDDDDYAMPMDRIRRLKPLLWIFLAPILFGLFILALKIVIAALNALLDGV
jgi:hypothetical protein